MPPTQERTQMKRLDVSLTVLATALLLLPVGCKPSKDSEGANATPAPAATPKTPAKPAAAAPKAAPKVAPKAAPEVKPAPSKRPVPPPPPGAVVQYAGAHVLVAYKGAQRAGPKITRTKAEALAKAKKLAVEATGGADFAKLAAKHSDGPSASRGGSLGTWRKGRMVPAFDVAIAKLEVGGVSEPVETGFGYHVIKRNPLPELRAGAHILIAYKGARRAKPTITRTKDEALAKAKELVTKARANPDGFADLAKANSDGPSGRRGGSLGKWPRGKMVPEFDTAIDTMKVGEISEPVETAFGYHVIRRLALK